MKVFHRIEEYLTLGEVINDLALEHRKRFGEAPSVGMTMNGLYTVYKQLGSRGNIEGGGKVEPLRYNILTPAGLVTLFEDRECSQTNIVSIVEPSDAG